MILPSLVLARLESHSRRMTATAPASVGVANASLKVDQCLPHG